QTQSEGNQRHQRQRESVLHLEPHKSFQFNPKGQNQIGKRPTVDPSTTGEPILTDARKASKVVLATSVKQKDMKFKPHASWPCAWPRRTASGHRVLYKGRAQLPPQGVRVFPAPGGEAAQSDFQRWL